MKKTNLKGKISAPYYIDILKEKFHDFLRSFTFTNKKEDTSFRLEIKDNKNVQ